MARRILVGLALAAAVVAGCSSNGGVGVELLEYSLDAPESTEAGSVTFSARNVGRIDHELVVLRTRRSVDELPVEDAEVQENGGDVDVLAKTPRIEPGRSRELTVRLDRGRYVLICNVPGHYLSGMRRELRVG